MSISAMTFYGAAHGPQRATVLPTLLAGQLFDIDHARLASIRSRAQSLPTLAQRAWLWAGLNFLQNEVSPNPLGQMRAWNDCAAGAKCRYRHHALRHSEFASVEFDSIDPSQLRSLYRALVNFHQADYREGSMHFGIASAQSVFSHAMDSAAIPAYVADLCAYLRGQSEGNLLTALLVFRQLVLIHPFVDGNGRFARLLACMLSAQGAFPRFILLPALAAFRMNEAAQCDYGTAMASSQFEAFREHMLALVERSLDELEARAASAEDLSMALSASVPMASFSARLRRHFSETGVVTVAQIVRFGGGSPANAKRWQERMADGDVFSAEGDELIWDAHVKFAADATTAMRAAFSRTPADSNRV